MAVYNLLLRGDLKLDNEVVPGFATVLCPQLSDRQRSALVQVPLVEDARVRTQLS